MGGLEDDFVREWFTAASSSGDSGDDAGDDAASVWGRARSCYPQSLVYSTEQWKMRNSGGVLLCMLKWWSTEPL